MTFGNTINPKSHTHLASGKFADLLLILCRTTLNEITMQELGSYIFANSWPPIILRIMGSPTLQAHPVNNIWAMVSVKNNIRELEQLKDCNTAKIGAWWLLFKITVQKLFTMYHFCEWETFILRVPFSLGFYLWVYNQ